jgi:hypothetical protein
MVKEIPAMKNYATSILIALIAFCLIIVIGGCGAGGTSTMETAADTTGQGSGTISASLVWGTAAKASAKTVVAAPAGVTRIRFKVSASDITSPIQRTFSSASGSGTIDRIPAGTGRTLTAEALDATGAMTHKGSANNITVLSGQTTEAGTITMNTVGVSMNMDQTLSDQAQNTTLAFSAMAMMTGNLGSQSFFPPGKIADYTGFQYLRDNDPDNMGHNTSFLTRVAENVMYILNDAQLAQLAVLAKSQDTNFKLYGAKRFPLMKAFRLLLEGDIPSGTTGLSLEAVRAASKELYRIDGQVSYDRAVLYSTVLNSLSTAQKAAIDAMVGKGWSSWPDTSVDPIKSAVEAKKSALGRDVDMVAIMTYSSDLFSWYAGSLEADVYFCPERHGTYFGSFFMKDAPAIGHEGYSINEQLTATAGRALSDSTYGYVDSTQATLMSSLVEIQRNNLYASTATLSNGVKNNIVAIRTEIAILLRTLIGTAGVDSSGIKAQVLALSETYGELDGENNYNYATVMASVYKTLTTAQKTKLMELRASIMAGTYTTGGTFDFTYTATPYLYSAVITDAIATGYIGNTDSLFK